MAEIEVHHHGHPEDDAGKRVGVLVGVVGILLSVITISSHRAHTDAVIHRTESNDQWTYYQSKKTREQISDVGMTVLSGLTTDDKKIEDKVKKLAASRDHYKSDAEEIQKEAKAKDEETHLSEKKALRFDLGEGLLELGLVLCSLYFLAKKNFFPIFGIISTVLGIIIGGSGYLL